MAKFSAVLIMVGAITFSVGCAKKGTDASSPAKAATPAELETPPSTEKADKKTDANQPSEFAKKIFCSVGIPDQRPEAMDLTYDATMKVLNLNFIVTREQDGTAKIRALKTAAEMADAFNLLLANEVNSSWISPNVMTYAPSSLQQMYQNRKMRAAGRFILTGEARIYSFDGNENDTVRLNYRDLVHGDEMNGEPNQKIELTIKDNLRMTARVPAVSPAGEETSADIEIACAIAK